MAACMSLDIRRRYGVVWTELEGDGSNGDSHLLEMGEGDRVKELFGSSGQWIDSLGIKLARAPDGKVGECA